MSTRSSVLAAFLAGEGAQIGEPHLMAGQTQPGGDPYMGDAAPMNNPQIIVDHGDAGAGDWPEAPAPAAGGFPLRAENVAGSNLLEAGLEAGGA